MSARLHRFLGRIVLFIVVAAGPGWADQPSINWRNPIFTEEFVPNELLIGFKGEIIPADVSTLHQQVGAMVVQNFGITPLAHVRIPSHLSMFEAARFYQQHPVVAYVEPNYIVRPMPTFPNDPDYGDLWGMDRIRAPEAWSLATGTHAIVVGVIDTGIFEAHEDLELNIAAGGFDFANNTPVQQDTHGHGTHVAGTIGAVGDNNIGVVGVNWRVKMIGLKFLDPFGTTANAIRAVEYAATNTALNIKITNNSWGGGGFSQGLRLAIKRAGEDYGQLFIAAAGNAANDNDEEPSYPASYDLPNIISVAAIGEDGDLASFSNFGETSVHIAAPGVGIRSTVPGGLSGGYTSLSGTSMAAPHVAGAAALLWSLNPDWPYEIIRDAILGSAAANPELSGKVSTGGELDLFAAFAALQPLVVLDRLAYRSDAVVTATIVEPTLDLSVTDVEARVEVTDPSDVLRWGADLDIPRSAGINFVTSFDLTSGVTAVEFDLLTVTYTNEAGDVATATAPIDDTPPVISDVQVISVTDSSATIRWHTDEPADSRYIVTDAIPPGGLQDLLPELGGGVFVDTPTVTAGVTQYVHTISIPLDTATKYFIAVLSEDYAGNKSSAPADLTSTDETDYALAITLHRWTVYKNDMEAGLAGWTVTNLNGIACWQYGEPTFGPPGAFRGERVWGTILDGNYPHLANASVVSTPVEVNLYPRITFWSWHQFAVGDFGMVEVNAGSGWQNVSQRAVQFDTKVEGASLSWDQVVIDLPEFSNKTIRVRFRMESDAANTAAGWYIDDFTISHVQPPGINIIGYEIDDSLGGDGDGFPEPGETFYLNLEVYNSVPGKTFTNVTAAVTIPVTGINMNPATSFATYGNLAPGDKAASGVQLEASIDPAILPGTWFTVFHSATAAGGQGPFPDTLQIQVTERESVSGMVTNIIGGAPISDAVIGGTAPGYDDVVALSTVTGQYVLHGLVPGVEYAIRASKPGEFSPSAPVDVIAPAVDINFGLGQAFADPDLLLIEAEVDQGGSVVTNLTLDNSAGDIPLEFDTSVDYLPHSAMPEPPAWIAISPASGTIPPGDQQILTITLDAALLTPSVEEYRAQIRLTSNDIGGEDIIIDVFLRLLSSPILFVDHVRVIGGDGDPFAEPGETLDLDIRLGNKGNAIAFLVEGGLAYTGGTATTVDDPDAAWTFIFPGDIQEPDLQMPEITVDGLASDGDVLPFNVTVTDFVGRVTSMDFALTVTVRHAISGNIYDLSTTDPVPGAEVTAEGNGLVLNTVSDASGNYAIYGLTNGTYQVYVIPPVPYAAPPSTNIMISGGNATDVDFGVATWAVSAAPTSVVVTVSEGVETNLFISIDNAGPLPGFVELEIQLVEGIPFTLVGDVTFPAVNWAELPADVYAANELLVRFEDGIQAQSEQSALSAVGAQVLHRYHTIPAAHIRVPGNQALQAIADTLAAHSAIRYVEPNYLQEPYGTPDDPSFPQQYNLRNTRQTGGTLGADIRAVEAWDKTVGKASVVVAIVDTGVKTNHVDLVDNLIPGYDYGNNDADPSPDWPAIGSEHGTHVSGIVGAIGNNAIGVAGVNWDVSLMPLKASTNFLNLFGFEVALLPLSATLAALEHAVTNDVKISNHSYGGIYFSGLTYEMIQFAMSNDHLFVAAAGNDAVNNDIVPHYPASYNLDNIISVAATDHNGLLASTATWGSNFGQNSVDIAAPGVNIMSTFLIDEFDSFASRSGTSMSAPHVAGVAALLKSVAPWATYDMLKNAIMLGARHDAMLEGVVASAGHLDAAAALERIRAFWLQVDPMKGNVPSGGSLLVNLTLNAGGQLPAGTYKADIVVRGGANALSLPVTVHVTPAPFPVITNIEIDDSVTGDGDGHAEPGETVDFYLTLLNDGSALYASPTGTLSSVTPGVTIIQGESAWPGISSDDHQVNLTGLRVTMPGAPGDVDFELTMTHPVHGPWVLPFTIPVETKHTISGFVRDAQTMNGLGSLKVEYWGAVGGSVLTESDGSYRVDGLDDGTYRLRALGVDHEKSAEVTRTLTGGDQTADFLLRRPEIAIGMTQLVFAVQAGQDQVMDLDLINPSSDAFEYDILISKPGKIALISDRSALAPVKPVLAEMGWQVNLWTGNLVKVAGAFTGRYSTDASIMLTHDLVILDLNGSAGVGRLLSAAEETLIMTYLGQGGKVMVVGANSLSRPDDRRMRDLVGSDSLDRSATVGHEAELQNALPIAANWVSIFMGDRVATPANVYDDATPATGVTATVYFDVDGSSKLMRRETAGGGVVYLWAGKYPGTTWSARGIWQDILRGLVEDELVVTVPWLSLTPPVGSITGGTVPLEVKAESAGLKVALHRALLLIRGNYPGSDIRGVPVTFDVVQPTLTAQSSTGVKDWMDQFLSGTGGSEASVFQLIYAGQNGEINPPTEDGGTTSDDVLLLTFPFAKDFGRIGVGYEWLPDLGRFEELFYHDLLPTTLTRNVYVRAWDAATFEDSVAYGDSSLYELDLSAYEAHDFGTWIVNQVLGYPGPLNTLKDSNGDSIPDGWYILNGMDPRLPIEPLTASWSLSQKAGVFGTGTNQFRHPSQLFLTDNFVYVLDRQNARISVWNRATLTHVLNYGTGGSGVGQFGTPYGMGKAPNADRFAIADSANNRVQVFTFDPNTGAITFERQFGSFGTGPGQFRDPRDVAIGPLGRFYVADKLNDRVQVFDPNGVHLFSFGAFGTAPGQMKAPQGIAVDDDGIVYVVDTDNNRIQGFTGGGGFLWQTGTAGSGPGQFNKPIGIQIGLGKRIYIADTSNHRIQVLDPMRNFVAAFGTLGSADGQVWFPRDVAPSFGSAAVYVADTYNHRIQKLITVMDGDGDGMDDTWELLNGLDPTDPSDAMIDSDGDDLLNIGEYRIGTNPQDPDTDGDGWTDGDEVAAGSDPLDEDDVPPYTIHIQSSGGAPLIWILWLALEGEVYDVQSATNLMTGPWVTLPDSIFTAGTTAVVGYTNTTQSGEGLLFLRPRHLE